MFSDYEKKSDAQPFSAEQIQRVLGSAAGQQLLQLLQRDGGATLRQAAQLVRQGDYAAAQQLLAPLMSTDEAARLVRKLNGQG